MLHIAVTAQEEDDVEAAERCPGTGSGGKSPGREADVGASKRQGLGERFILDGEGGDVGRFGVWVGN